MRLLSLLGLALASTALAQPALTSEQLQAAATYSRAQAGLSLVIWQNGTEVFSEAENGGSLDEYYELASGTKSFCGVIAAAAVADGFLAFDELAADTLTEWKSDPRKAKITVRMLLHLTSGLDATGFVLAPTYAEAVARSAVDEPGTHFVYDPVHFQAFGELMRRKLAARGAGSPVEYLKVRVLNRIGVTVGNWRLGADGNPLMPQGAQLTAREWIKFGEFIRLEGQWQGTQIVPAALIQEIRSPGPLNPAYGLTWWLNHPMDEALLAASSVPDAIKDGHIYPEGDADIHMAAGAGNQRLYIIPRLNVVVARQSPVVNGSSFDDEALLKILAPPQPPTALVNVSTRGLAGKDDQTLIGGFVINGTRTKTVLVRGAGPGLAQFNVPTYIRNPRIEVFDAKGRSLKANDDWNVGAEAAKLPDAFKVTGAFAFASGSRDAALLISLAPGAYTVHVSPASGEPGIGLVEVYEMPESFSF